MAKNKNYFNECFHTQDGPASTLGDFLDGWELATLMLTSKSCRNLVWRTINRMSDEQISLRGDPDPWQFGYALHKKSTPSHIILSWMDPDEREAFKQIARYAKVLKNTRGLKPMVVQLVLYNLQIQCRSHIQKIPTTPSPSDLVISLKLDKMKNLVIQVGCFVMLLATVLLLVNAPKEQKEQLLQLAALPTLLCLAIPDMAVHFSRTKKVNDKELLKVRSDLHAVVASYPTRRMQGVGFFDRVKAIPAISIEEQAPRINLSRL